MLCDDMQWTVDIYEGMEPTPMKRNRCYKPVGHGGLHSWEILGPAFARIRWSDDGVNWSQWQRMETR